MSWQRSYQFKQLKRDSVSHREATINNAATVPVELWFQKEAKFKQNILFCFSSSYNKNKNESQHKKTNNMHWQKQSTNRAVLLLKSKISSS